MSRITIPARHHELFGVLSRLLEERGAQAWLVGGYLRDVLLGRPGDDLDLAVDGPALELARAFADGAGGAFVRLDDATETARVVWKRPDGRSLVLDLVRLRAPSIEDDLKLRDLTINALALPLHRAVAGPATGDELIDPLDGRADLAAQALRPCGPHAFVDDPLRMLRAVRLGAQLGFDLLPEADVAIRSAAALIGHAAHERVRDELLKLLSTPRAAPWLAYLDDVRLLTAIVPELEPARGCTQPAMHFLPVLEHLLETVAAAEWLHARMLAAVGDGAPLDEADRRPYALPAAARVLPLPASALPFGEQLVARLAESAGGYPRLAAWKLGALLHDVGKPATHEAYADGRITFHGHEAVGADLAVDALQRLRFPRDIVAYVRLLVAEHMRPGQLRSLGPELTVRAVYRLLRDMGAAAPDVLLLAMCDHMAVRGPMLQWDWWVHQLGWTAALLETAFVAPPAQLDRRLISGDDVLALGVPPGPVVGRVLAAVLEAQDAGEIRTREEAIELAARLVSG